ncbi:MAG: penicillin-binding protein 2 [Lachnospira sp.]|nr:penicillin-binding protein 2 [Lachnospira sp.]
MTDIRGRNPNKKKAVRRRAYGKSAAAFFLTAVLLFILVGRIGCINVTKGDTYSKIVLNHQAYTSETLTAKRGEIVDRNGTILAYSEKVYNLIIDPAAILSDSAYAEPTIRALTEQFPQLSESDIRQVLADYPNSRYRKILTKLTESEIAGMNEILADTEDNPNITGIYFEATYQREYPFDTLACDTIGYADSGGGELGLERKYDSELTGTNGQTYNYVNEDLDSEEATQPAQDGLTVVTTIDYQIQSIIDNYLVEYNNNSPAKGMAVIAMNPNNGEILAMSNWPFFNLNSPRDLSGAYTQEEIEAMSEDDTLTALNELWNNYAVSQIYEPGSTFKSITVASALEENLVSESSHYYCSGAKQVEDYLIKCVAYSEGGHGSLTLEEGLGYSCNVELMDIGEALGSEKMRKHQDDFGFGSKTGIDLPSEERGLVKDADTMDAVDVATNSFGQNISVTMVQMASAYASMINGGSYYKPHLVKAFENSSGDTVQTVAPTLVRRTVTEETSETMRKFLEDAVTVYGVQEMKVPGYRIGGKTGTAQKIPRTDLKWVTSAISFVPADNPSFLLYVVIDEENGTSGTTEANSNEAQHITRTLYQRLLPYLGIEYSAEIEAQQTAALEKVNQSKVSISSESAIDSPQSSTADTTNAEYEAG